MAFTRDPNRKAPMKFGAYPITTGFAVMILIALALLIMLRHLFGSVRLEVGAK